MCQRKNKVSDIVPPAEEFTTHTLFHIECVCVGNGNRKCAIATTALNLQDYVTTLTAFGTSKNFHNNQTHTRAWWHMQCGIVWCNFPVFLVSQLLSFVLKQWKKKKRRHWARSRYNDDCQQTCVYVLKKKKEVERQIYGERRRNKKKQHMQNIYGHCQWNNILWFTTPHALQHNANHQTNTMSIRCVS